MKKKKNFSKITKIVKGKYNIPCLDKLKKDIQALFASEEN